MNWKNVFNTNHRHWHHIDIATTAAREAGYTMFCWNGRVYAVPGKDKIVNLNKPLFLIDDLG